MIRFQLIYDLAQKLFNVREFASIRNSLEILQFTIPWSETLSIFVSKKLAIINALRSSDGYARYICME